MDLVLTGAIDASAELVKSLDQALGAPLQARTSASGRSLRLTNVDPDFLEAAGLAAQCARLKLDYALMSGEARLTDYGLIALDMDSTLITIESIDEMAELCGVGPDVARITEAAMRGEISDFQTSLKERLALMAGAPVAILERVYAERLQLSPGAESLLAGARAAGLKVLVVSGGFTFFLDRLKERLQLDFTRANTLEIVDGALTGRVLGAIVDGNAKRDMVLQTCAALGLAPERTIVVGDGANDLKMMAIAGMSVAYHAKPVVAKATTHAIRHGGLDVVLEWFEAIG